MTVRLGIVGFGSLVESHLLPAVRAAERFRVVAVAEPRPGAAEEVARLGSDIRHVADYSELDAAAVDAVLVAVPNHLHREVASHFLERDTHVFCEKPLATSSADCRELIELGERTGRRLMVGHVLRYAPAVRFARELVRSELFGEFRYLSCSQGTARPIRSRSGFYSYRSQCGGGVIMDKAIHLLDLFELLLGEIEIDGAWLAATDSLGAGLEDEVAIELRAAGASQPSVYLVSRVRKLDGRLTMVFDRGHLHLNVKDFSQLTLSCPYGVLGRSDSASVSFPHADLFEAEMRHLAEVIEEGAPCEADGTVGLRAVEHVEAVYRRLGL